MLLLDATVTTSSKDILQQNSKKNESEYKRLVDALDKITRMDKYVYEVGKEINNYYYKFYQIKN